MGAAEALKAARAAGMRVGIDGNDLVLEASAIPPRRDRPVVDDEPAGIAQFDGGLPRARLRRGDWGPFNHGNPSMRTLQ
jgi:hypothetical protein